MNKTYYDYAENDYGYLMDSYNRNMIWNNMCAIGAQICEKYLKHIIDTYYNPQNDNDFLEKEYILKTHNLKKLLKFLKDNMTIEPDISTKNALIIVSGYYFETRYPGDDSFFVEKEDIENAVNAAKLCKNFTDKIIYQYTKQNIKNENDSDIEEDIQI